MNRNSKQFKDDTKRFESLSQNTVKCECGCSTTFTLKTDRTICRWCGNYVYRTPELEFKYKVKSELYKIERGNNEVKRTF